MKEKSNRAKPAFPCRTPPQHTGIIQTKLGACTVWHEIFEGVYFCGLGIFFFCFEETNFCEQVLLSSLRV